MVYDSPGFDATDQTEIQLLFENTPRSGPFVIVFLSVFPRHIRCCRIQSQTNQLVWKQYISVVRDVDETFLP